MDKAVAGNPLSLNVNDELMTRLLDIQQNDGGKIDEVVLHVFELGVSARENSIKAQQKRKQEEAKAKAFDALNQLLALNPSIAAQPEELMAAMQRLGIVAAKAA